MRLLRIAVRAPLLAAHMAAGAALAWLFGEALGERFARGWSRIACRIIGLRISRRGFPAEPPALWAANHVSWLEALALEATAPLCFVAKSEVARWPVVGRIAAAAGTLFLRRGSPRAAARVAESAWLRLAEGRSVAVFPEGTSTDGTGVLPFKSALFEAAARLGCDVQPVAVRYPSRGAAVAPFIGDDEFLPHLLRVLGEKEIVIELRFLPAFSAHGRGREDLAEAARDAVVGALPYFRSAERSLTAP